MPEPNTGCWLWLRGTDSDGYGEIKYEGRPWRAHRLSWTAYRGPIPHGLQVLHRCDTPSCCNPDHLFLGTNNDNHLDKIRKGRQATGDRNGARRYPERLPCGENHWTRRHPERLARGERHGSVLHPETKPRGEKHKRAKLTTEKVIAIRRATDSLREIAEKHGIGIQLACKVRLRQIWRHVPEDTP